MESSILSIMPEAQHYEEQPARRKKKSRAPRLTAYARLTVIEQTRRAFRPGARLAGVTGLVLGGFVPCATYLVVHYETAARPELWALVAGGLLYSALTVYQWARAAFASQTKAIGFCVLLEGNLAFAHLRALGLSALVVLIFVNAVSAACCLQVRRNQ